jgi:hypothetical protein
MKEIIDIIHGRWSKLVSKLKIFSGKKLKLLKKNQFYVKI